MEYTGYAGTYTGSGSEGIYRFSYDGQNLREATLFARVKNPKYLCFVGDCIAAVADDAGAEDGEEQAGVKIFNREGKCVAALAYEKSSSCHIAAEGNRIYTANYHEGTLSVLHWEENKLQLCKKILFREKAGAHQVLLYRDKILVPCLFLDAVMIVDKKRLQTEGGIFFEESAGPRHGVFSEDGSYLYVIGELSNRVYALNMENLQVENAEDVLEEGESFVKDSAAIRRKDNLLYVSTRSKDVISVLECAGSRLQRLQVQSAGGAHPRDFIVYPDGRLLVANRFSNQLCLFDTKEGLLTEAIGRLQVPEAVSIIVKENENE